MPQFHEDNLIVVRMVAGTGIDYGLSDVQLRNEPGMDSDEQGHARDVVGRGQDYVWQSHSGREVDHLGRISQKMIRESTRQKGRYPPALRRAETKKPRFSARP